MPKAQLESKSFAMTECKMTDGKFGHGGFSGYASVKGNIDSYGDVIDDGAYKNIQEVLIKKGWSGFNHSSDAVGMVMNAVEDAKGLFIEVDFHSTADAQSVRTKMKERMDAGKEVGMSIMFKTLDAVYEVRDEVEIRVLKGIEVVEAGFVMLPANTAATVTSVKSGSGTSLGEDFEAARELVEKVIGRVSDLKEKCDGDLTAGRIAKVEELHSKCGELLDAIRAKTADDPPAMASPEEVAGLAALLVSSGALN
jgi:uncharacterized protein